MRKLAKVVAAARRDQSRSWSKKTAYVIDLCLRNGGRIDPQTINEFAKLSPKEADVLPMVPLLEKWALNGVHETRAVAGLVEKSTGIKNLSAPFLRRYLDHLQKTNPFEAIRIWKIACPNDTELGILLYLEAKQLDRAERLAESLPAPSSRIVRSMVQCMVGQKHFSGIQKWVDIWQAMDPRDLRWLNHVSGMHGLQLHLPQTLEVFPEHRLKVDGKQQRLVELLNAMIREELHLPAIHDRWTAAMASPTQHNLQLLALEIAPQFPTSNWVPILRLVNSSCAIALLRTLEPSPRAFGATISRAETIEQLSEILLLIEPEQLYTAPCLDALARRSPTTLAELAVPPELLSTTLQTHHLVALWTAHPSDEVVAWLFPLTLAQLDSAFLLRAAVNNLDDLQKIEALVREYVINRGYALAPGALQPHTRLRKPAKHDLSKEEAEAVVAEQMTAMETR